MVYSHAMRPVFSPVAILLTILGFMLFWPLGLVMLAFVLWGGHAYRYRQQFHEMCGGWRRDWERSGPRGFSRSGNSAFDDYRERELRRLDEERRKLDEERREFEAYVRNLRRARDQEEFDRFQRERNNRRPSGETIDL
ncbi:MAG TPA: DUF2852 domain-containing protein [Bauldia sp.]|nr:DUF2852 domain-containing protein [Bauldia sp.]